jgi:hypothetical protein
MLAGMIKGRVEQENQFVSFVNKLFISSVQPCVARS